jgi:hypothetical protein
VKKTTNDIQQPTHDQQKFSVNLFKENTPSNPFTDFGFSRVWNETGA